MKRLTTNKNVSEMGMSELAYNCCYIKDRKARYRDYDLDMDARELTRKLLKDYAEGDDAFKDDEDFDDQIIDYLQDGMNSMEGMIALLYRNLWAMADLRESLKKYEDLEEQGKLLKEWIPCSKRFPESEKEVEITYVRKHWKTGEPVYFTARAFYEDGTINTADSSFGWEDTDNWEYDEEKDCYIIPEGWFESVSFAEEFGTVDSPVIAWREIVEPYKPEGR